MQHIGKYTISTTRPAPSMSQDHVEFIGTYEDAVKAAHDSWRRTHRATSITSYMYCYHAVDYLGNFWDKNTNSGVPEAGLVLV